MVPVVANILFSDFPFLKQHAVECR